MKLSWATLLAAAALLLGGCGATGGARTALPQGSQQCTVHNIFDSDAPNYPIAPGMNVYASFTSASSMPILIEFTEASIDEDFACVIAPLSQHTNSQWVYQVSYSTSPVTDSDGSCTYSDQTTNGHVRITVDTSAATAYVSVNGDDIDTPTSGTGCTAINNPFAFNDTVPFPSY